MGEPGPIDSAIFCDTMSWELKEAAQQALKETDTDPVFWDVQKHSFIVTLRGIRISDDPGAEPTSFGLTPPEQYVVHIRVKGTTDWGAGFITPLKAVGFTDLEPGQYEIKVTAVDHQGEIISGREWTGKLDA